jgi:hypothetical protein
MFKSLVSRDGCSGVFFLALASGFFFAMPLPFTRSAFSTLGVFLLQFFLSITFAGGFRFFR